MFVRQCDRTSFTLNKTTVTVIFYMFNFAVVRLLEGRILRTECQQVLVRDVS
jgi:hypothetical protein